MDALHKLMSRFRMAQAARDERGVTALEYALIATLIGVAIIGGATTFGGRLNTAYASIGVRFTAAK